MQHMQHRKVNEYFFKWSIHSFKVLSRELGDANLSQKRIVNTSICNIIEGFHIMSILLFLLIYIFSFIVLTHFFSTFGLHHKKHKKF